MSAFSPSVSAGQSVASKIEKPSREPDMSGNFSFFDLGPGNPVPHPPLMFQRFPPRRGGTLEHRGGSWWGAPGGTDGTMEPNLDEAAA
jgi:hypothetical protein